MLLPARAGSWRVSMFIDERSRSAPAIALRARPSRGDSKAARGAPVEVRPFEPAPDRALVRGDRRSRDRSGSISRTRAAPPDADRKLTAEPALEAEPAFDVEPALVTAPALATEPAAEECRSSGAAAPRARGVNRAHATSKLAHKMGDKAILHIDPSRGLEYIAKLPMPHTVCS
jgi:hypothetical protein